MAERSDAGIPKENNNHALVRIIGGLFDGSEFPATQVLPKAWDVFGKLELNSGEGLGEYDPGTRCRVIFVSRGCTKYRIGDLFEYNGWQWLPVKEER